MWDYLETAVFGLVAWVPLVLHLLFRRRTRRTMRALTTELEAATLAVHEAQAAWQAEYEARTRHVEMVSVANGERDRWRDKFFECATMHSAAQEMLLREREVLMQQVRLLGRQPRGNPAIDAVTAEFGQKFGKKALENSGRISGGEAVDKPPSNE
jgi:hypothetical protein